MQLMVSARNPEVLISVEQLRSKDGRRAVRFTSFHFGLESRDNPLGVLDCMEVEPFDSASAIGWVYRRIESGAARLAREHKEVEKLVANARLMIGGLACTRS